jgi:hypothetical protein
VGSSKEGRFVGILQILADRPLIFEYWFSLKNAEGVG